ncbi:MAG: hypothetical protein QNL12_01250 [Acidimicrobiia bacterium]|nr:hypothetical protein [Acidimicrobiia bacterium]MDX2465912.1 hypothetical protein [Acidimicrobiia bacterium]
MDVTPALILAMWTAGVAGGAAIVSYWSIVGPGYGWLLSGVVVVIAGATAFSGNLAVAAIAVAAALGAGVLAKRHRLAAALFGVAAVTQLAVAMNEGGVVQAVTGTLLLGAMTSEMLLGHWFLVDPQLPRWALQRLDLAAGVGLGLDLIVVAALGAFGGGDVVMIGAMVALVVMTGLLVAAVWFSLKEPGYSGVMAATGLSYLGVLTTFGVVVVGRLLLTGL